MAKPPSGERREDRLLPGDPAPHFTLHTPHEVELSLGPLLEDRFLVLEFIRGTWDPNARERLEEISRAKPLFGSRGARALAVSCEPPHTARSWIEGQTGPIRLAVDPLGEVARAYGVFQRFSWGAVRVAQPATFVIDRCAYVRWSHVGRSPIRTAPLRPVFRLLDELGQEAAGAGGTRSPGG